MDLKGRRILSIEAIRGGAAIYVMLGHIVLLYRPYQFFPEYEFLTKTIFGYGHQAVLLFFIVSGFSITYSSSMLAVSDIQSLKDYFYKRFRRIYPLFFIALVISLIVLKITGMESGLNRNILSFLFLTDTASGAIMNPIPTNFPIWSLSYEVVYYLLFPLMLFLWRKIGQTSTLLLFLIGGIFTGLAGFTIWPNHLFNLLQYYWIWIAGAMLADAFIKEKRINFRYLKGLLISSIAFMFTVEEIPIISYWFWSFFFILVFLLFYSEEQKPSNRERIMNLVLSLGSIVICYFLTYSDSVVYHYNLLRVLLTGLGIITLILNYMPIQFLKKFVRILLNPFVRSGSFSYALYIIHWPLITISVFVYSNYFQSSLLVMFGFVVINILIIVLMSWFLEERLQPVIARGLNKWYYKKGG